MRDQSLTLLLGLGLQYDGVQRVTREVIQGLGSSVSSGGLGTQTYSYQSSGFANGYNSWLMKQTTTYADGNQRVVYTNYVGEVMLDVYKDTTSGTQWVRFNEYDASGRLILAAQPSAVTGYDETKADLLNMIEHTGLSRGPNGQFISSPDFTMTQGGIRRIFDVTTAREIPKHARRYGSQAVDYLIYTRPPGLNFP